MPHSNKDEYNEYMNRYMKERWRRRRLEAIVHLGESCDECGISFKIVDLQFHHTDPNIKVSSVARLSSASEKKFWDEVNKCVLLCEDCHLETHS